MSLCFLALSCANFDSVCVLVVCPSRTPWMQVLPLLRVSCLSFLSVLYLGLVYGPSFSIVFDFLLQLPHHVVAKIDGKEAWRDGRMLLACQDDDGVLSVFQLACKVVFAASCASLRRKGCTTYYSLLLIYTCTFSPSGFEDPGLFS